MEKLFIKGITFGWGAKRGEYREPHAIDSLQKLRQTGAEWIALSFWTYQETIYSTEITFDYGYTVTDGDIAYVVRKAKSLGLKICLKPVVNSRDGIWRGHIGFSEEEGLAGSYWDRWFESYGNFINHYAELAQELECEMFCIGCEMVGTERQTENWNRLIAGVKEIYKGSLIYNANHGSEFNLSWWDRVDVIGISAYYRIASVTGESETAMAASWQRVKPRLIYLHNKYKKQIVFMEIGCRSALGCAMAPWDFMQADVSPSEEEQANFYSSALRTFWDEPWFSGFFWWDWSVNLYPLNQSRLNSGFDIYGKKAEEVVKSWYLERKL